MMFEAPGRFSTKKLWPSTAVSPAASSRALASGPLPATDDGTFYHADLIGLSAVTRSGEALGEVIAVHGFGAGDILEVRLADGATLMLPFTEQVVPEIDIAAGRILVDPPEDAVEG